MGRPKGSTHTEETRARMSKTRTGTKHTAEWNKKISEANKGRKVQKKHPKVCIECGVHFMAAAINAKYHSYKCRRAANGHGIRHSAAFVRFEQKCAICGSLDQLVGDHNHDTGKPRGILCRNCNLAIGNMFDIPDRLRAAADYLESSK